MSLLSTSGVIVILCILFSLYIVMNRRSASVSATHIGAEVYAEDVLEHEADDTAVQGHSGYPLTHQAATEAAASFTGAYRLKRGRIAIFAVACCAFLAALITLPIALFTSLSWVVPPALFALSISALATLRLLAIRDCHKRRSGSVAQAEEQKNRVSAQPLRENTEVATEIELKQIGLTPARTRSQLPVNHAVRSLRMAKTHHQPQREALVPQPLDGDTAEPRARMETKLPDQSWAPVEVPLPTYLEMPAAHTELPEAIERDTDARSTTDTLAQAAFLDLDEVLRRRRA
ncbi:MAG: hypothetical protein Q3965_02675 [Rothia sp. (in: high G+C Gram-positive bacteria)]|nr:hypothetical protein [Rothia sp. (in: high G+C Gram-positive bacteria)]